MWVRSLILVFGLMASRVTLAAELVAVVNPLNPTTELSKKTIRKLFVGSVRYWDGGSVAVVTYLRPEASPAGDALMEVCRLTRGQFDAMWRRRQLAGGGIQPGELGDLADVLATIADDPRGITVITAEEMAGVQDTATVRLIPVSL